MAHVVAPRTVRRRIDPGQGAAAVKRWLASAGGTTPSSGDPADGAAPDRTTLATAVRWSLEELAQRAPGRSVEVRVPPFGVTQCVEGPRHTRGTPPNVIETDAATWLRLVTGLSSWSDEIGSGRVRASGGRAQLEGLLPLGEFGPGPAEGGPAGTVEP